MIDKLEEVLRLLASFDMAADSVVVDGDRVEVSGLRRLNEFAPKEYQKRNVPSPREMLFAHTGFVPVYNKKTED